MSEPDPEIEAGKNGEVYPCPNCGKHKSVKWLPGDEYRYHCDDCGTTFTPKTNYE